MNTWDYIVMGIPIRITEVYPEEVFALSNGMSIIKIFWAGAEIATIHGGECCLRVETIKEIGL